MHFMAIVFLEQLNYSKPASLNNIEYHTYSNIKDHTHSNIKDHTHSNIEDHTRSHIEDHTHSNIDEHTQSKAVCLSETALSINCPANSVIAIISVGYAYLDQCNKAESFIDCTQAR